MLDKQRAISDPDNEYIKQYGFVTPEELAQHLSHADIFVFASSCENMPVTLIEAMAAGLPIASSNRGPMPEVLADGGVYFDPEDMDSIAMAIKKIVQDSLLRSTIATRAKELAMQYSWRRCAEETLAFTAETIKGVKK